MHDSGTTADLCSDSASQIKSTDTLPYHEQFQPDQSMEVCLVAEASFTKFAVKAQVKEFEVLRISPVSTYP